MLVIASLTLSLLVIELALRWRFPIEKSTLPTIFDRRVGLIIKPGSEMESTNYSDYSLTQVVYDREERSRLAVEQGRFAEQHFIKPFKTILDAWSANYVVR